MRMDHIIDGVLRFQRDVYPNKAALYRELSLAQAPTALFIGCSDSRVVPELLTQQGPGGSSSSATPATSSPPTPTSPAASPPASSTPSPSSASPTSSSAATPAAEP